MLKLYLTIILYLGLLFSLIGFIIPFCISYPNDQLVILGIIFLIGIPILIYVAIKSVIKQLKKINEKILKN